MITLQQEPLFSIVDEVDDLLQMHYEELCLNKDKVKLAPIWDKYVALENAGVLYVYTARADGILIGYAAFFVQPHLHYSALITAANDVLFIHPDHRGSAGLRLIKFCEKMIATLKQPGAELKIVWRAKFGTVLHGLLPKMHYESEEIAFGKIL